MLRPTPARARHTSRIALALVCALALTAAGAGLLLRRAPQPLDAALRGTPVVPPRSAQDFVLEGARGSPVHLIDAAYRSTFLFFGYTHCPDECPLALASLGRAYRSLPPAARARTRIVFVSVDPARDTPPVMQRYVAAFDPHIAGLTASRALLTQVWQAYGVRVDPASHEIVHGGSIYAIDGTGHVVLEYPPDTAAKDLAADALILAKN